MTQGPLSGIRVLDFTLIWAGPASVMLLSDMGAEVIRVESCQHHITNTRGYYPKPTKEMVPKMGTLGRMYADLDTKDTPWNRHALFNGMGRDRYSMTVDLRRPEGREIVHDLVRISDVLVENNTVGLMKRFELDYDTVRSLNPTLIYVTMPMFGLTGPYTNYVGFGGNAEGIAGLASLRGYRDSDATAGVTNAHMDATSGIGGAYATLVALHERERTGRGQLVEFAQIEHMIQQMGGPLMDAVFNGRRQVPLGNRDAVRAPQGIYPCRGNDRWVAISVGTDEEWAGLCKAMDEPGWAKAPQYQGNLTRQLRHDELDKRISDWTASKDPGEIAELLAQTGVPAGVVANDKDLYEDTHLEARGFFHWKEHPDCGRHRYPGHSFKYLGTPLRFDTPAPILGQHNDLVYRQLLGFDDQDVARLTKEGHIGDRYTQEAL